MSCRKLTRHIAMTTVNVFSFFCLVCLFVLLLFPYLYIPLGYIIDFFSSDSEDVKLEILL
jgi:hypothetical protein